MIVDRTRSLTANVCIEYIIESGNNTVIFAIKMKITRRSTISREAPYRLTSILPSQMVQSPERTILKANRLKNADQS